MVLISIREDSGCSSVIDDFCRVHGFREDLIELSDELPVVDKTWLGLIAVAIDQLAGLHFGQSDSNSANAGTESGFSDGALAEFVEVDEELLDTDTILSDACLDALLDIVFVAEIPVLPLVIALMTMS